MILWNNLIEKKKKKQLFLEFQFRSLHTAADQSNLRRKPDVLFWNTVRNFFIIFTLV